MTPSFWFWLFMAIWFIWGGVMGYRGRAGGSPFYWGVGWNLLLFLILLMVGLIVADDPFKTLVK